MSSYHARRIGDFLTSLQSVVPEQRLGQIICNSLGINNLYYLEDDELIGCLQKYLQLMNERKKPRE